MNIPNFDSMDQDSLMKFWSKYRRPSHKDAEELVGDRRPKYTSIASTLASYACAKACAINLRLKGEISRAQIYESHCEIYYQKLPKDIQW